RLGKIAGIDTPCDVALICSSAAHDFSCPRTVDVQRVRETVQPLPRVPGGAGRNPEAQVARVGAPRLRHRFRTRPPRLDPQAPRELAGGASAAAATAAARSPV